MATTHGNPLESTRLAGPRRGAKASRPAPMDAAEPPPKSERASARTATTEDALQSGLMAGDRGALEEIHRRYRRRLEGVAFRILRNGQDAEDVVQRIFVALSRASQSSFRGRSSLWTYLYRAAVNGSMNVLRTRRRRDTAEGHLYDVQQLTRGEREAGPEAKILEGEILAEVAQALLKVKPQHRRVLVLRIVHGLSNSEIARREGLPLPTVGTWLRRGREELRLGMGGLLRELGRGGDP